MSKPKLGIYKHYKGKKYHIIGIAKHSEIPQELVIYKSHGNPGRNLWARPKDIFMEKVTMDGREISRFQFLK